MKESAVRSFAASIRKTIAEYEVFLQTGKDQQKRTYRFSDTSFFVYAFYGAIKKYKQRKANLYSFPHIRSNICGRIILIKMLAIL